MRYVMSTIRCNIMLLLTEDGWCFFITFYRHPSFNVRLKSLLRLLVLIYKIYQNLYFLVNELVFNTYYS